MSPQPASSSPLARTPCNSLTSSHSGAIHSGTFLHTDAAFNNLPSHRKQVRAGMYSNTSLSRSSCTFSLCWALLTTMLLMQWYTVSMMLLHQSYWHSGDSGTRWHSEHCGSPHIFRYLPKIHSFTWAAVVCLRLTTQTLTTNGTGSVYALVSTGEKTQSDWQRRTYC